MSTKVRGITIPDNAAVIEDGEREDGSPYVVWGVRGGDDHVLIQVVDMKQGEAAKLPEGAELPEGVTLAGLLRISPAAVFTKSALEKLLALF